MKTSFQNIYFEIIFNILKDFSKQRSGKRSSIVEEFNATIYPNPFQDQFTIEFKKGKSIRLEITDLYGKVYESKFIDKSTMINSSSWTRGVYIVSLCSEGAKIKQQKVVLTR